MGDQGVVDDVETHVPNSNRAQEARRPRAWQATGSPRHSFAGVKPPVRGKVGGTDWGGEPMPEQEYRDDPSPRERPGPDETEAERRRRRARFLRELAEARALRDRVQPRRAKAARLRHAMRMRTFRW
ncbi:hypothetical protein GCM10010398_30800 [Streptomyces fimbriatus]